MIAGIVFVGLLCLAAGLFASRSIWNAHRIKTGEGSEARVIVGFWATIAGYFLFLSLVKFSFLGAASLGGDLSLVAYYLQTTSGAFTIPWMVYIVSFVVLGSRVVARVAAAFFAVIAAVVVGGVLLLGVDGPHADAWSVEYVPASQAIRITILVAYVVIPGLLGFVLAYASRRLGGEQEKSVRQRYFLLGSSVVLMYVPEALTYVRVAPGAQALILHLVALVGAFLGWLAYAPRSERPRLGERPSSVDSEGNQGAGVMISRKDAAFQDRVKNLI